MLLVDYSVSGPFWFFFLFFFFFFFTRDISMSLPFVLVCWERCAPVMSVAKKNNKITRKWNEKYINNNESRHRHRRNVILYMLTGLYLAMAAWRDHLSLSIRFCIFLLFLFFKFPRVFCSFLLLLWWFLQAEGYRGRAHLILSHFVL